jgi:hypothetical protein
MPVMILLSILAGKGIIDLKVNAFQHAYCKSVETHKVPVDFQQEIIFKTKK